MQIDPPGLGPEPPLNELPRSTLFFTEHGIRPIWRLLLYLAIVLTPAALLTTATHMATGGAPIPGGPLVLTASVAIPVEFAQFVLVFFATWIMSRIEDRSVLSYGLEAPAHNLGLTVAGVLWGLLFMSVLIGVLWITHYLVFTGVLLSGGSAVKYGLVWGVNFIIVGFFEECLFRGYLQFILALCFADLVRRLAPGHRNAAAIGFWIAAILINFGFGFAHRSNPGESPVGLVCAGVAGLLFAFSLWRTGVLWWAIGLHAAWDWAQSYVFGVADSGTITANHLLASHPNGPVLMSGGSTGPEGSLFVLPVMLLILLAIVLTLRGKRSANRPLPLAGHSTFTTAAQVNSPRA